MASIVKSNRFPILFFVVLTIIQLPAYAAFTSRYSNWVGFDIGGPVNPESRWHYDIMNQARVPTDPTRLEQYFIRPSIYYQLDNHWSFWLGYDFISENPEDEPAAVEQRIWPQIEYDAELNKYIAISLRTRLENRWLSNRSGTAIRFRQRVELSISNWNKYDISFDVFDELFLGLQKPTWVSNRTIDQNRVFIGFVIPINKCLAIDTGYLNIFRPRTPKNTQEHILVLALSINLDGRSAIPIRAV